jgi:peroxiredoxin
MRPYSIEGDIRGLKNDSVIIFERKGVERDTHFVQAVEGKFFLKGTISQPSNAYVVLGGLRSGKNFSFFLEPGKISMKGQIDSLDDVAVTGTPNNNDLFEERRRENYFYKKIRPLVERQRNKETSKQEQEELGRQVLSLRDSISQTRLRFIRSHPNSLASATYLYVQQDYLSVDELDKVYHSLDLGVRQSEYGKIVGDRLAAKKTVVIGKVAPNFVMNDLNGKPFDLASLKGKYVLLDFWASWCVPCRAENPYLVAAYEKFKGKGFTIVGISLDHDGKKWKEAVEKDQLNWIHVSDLDAFNNKVAKLYGVQPIPDNFLIDPSGRIRARKLRGEELDKTLSQLIQ